MLVNDILDTARDQSYTLEADLSNTTLITYLNTAYKWIVSSITELDENYFWQKFLTDSVVDQSEYSLPSNWEKVFKAFIKYNSSDNFVECKYFWDVNTDKDDSYLQENCSEENPIFQIKDESIFIYPAPNAVIINSIKLYATQIPDNLAVDWVEASIEIKPKYHDVLWMWTLPFIFARLGMFNEMRTAQQNFELRKQQLLNDIVPRKPTPMYEQSVDMSSYE